MRIFSLLKSVKLAVALILILAGTSIIGTLFPQDLPPSHGIELYGEGAHRVLSFLGFFDLYHSGWFVCLVLLLALNILVCSLSRVRRTYRLTVWKEGGDPSRPPSGLSLRKTRTFSIPPDEVWSGLEKGLRHLGFRPRRDAGGIARMDRGRAGRWGPEITHLGFLVIIAGMVIGSLTGFRGRMDLGEGEQDSRVVVPSKGSLTLPFEVRCDDFEAVFYEGSRRPKEYTSWLTVLEDGQERVQKSIEVNDPLKHRGYWFYQSTYGRIGPAPGEEWIRLLVHPENVQLDLAIGERKRIEGTDDEVELLRFEPDFVMDANREVTSRSNELRNPAAQIRVYRKDVPIYKQWIFSEFPQVHPPEDIAHLFSLTDFAYREFTGLQVAYDPGVPVVWTGCGFLIAGLFLSFTVPHRRVWVRVVAEGEGCVLRLALGGRGGLRRFEESMDDLLDGLGGKPYVQKEASKT